MTLKEYIIKNKLTRENAALLFGVQRMTIYNWLNGVSIPTRRTMAKINEITNGAVAPKNWF